MGRKPTGNPMGRPTRKIPQSEFEMLCRINPTIEEVCSAFQCDDNQINYWCRRTYGSTFAEVKLRFGCEGKLSVRRKIWQKALKDGDADQRWALDKLANKHLDMGTHAQTSLSVANADGGPVKVVWQAVTPEEAKDYFDK